MPLSQALASQLPLLRRYARALTGSQRRGDELVAATLQALIDSPAAQQPTLPARVGLYRAFHARSVDRHLFHNACFFAFAGVVGRMNSRRDAQDPQKVRGAVEPFPACPRCSPGAASSFQGRIRVCLSSPC